MEDREFELEQNKFTFEKAKHIDDMRFQTFGTLYRQLFTFNIGILTLIFFVIYQSLEYDVSRWLHFFLMLAILLSTISIRLLVSVYVNSGKNLNLEMDAVFAGYSDTTAKIYKKRKRKNERNANWSYYFCLAGWICVFATLCFGIFTVDFTKQKDDKINKIEIINCGMTNINQNTQNIIKDTVETKSLEPSTYSAFSMATLGQQKPQTESFSQKPQPTSTTKQPSNKQ